MSELGLILVRFEVGPLFNLPKGGLGFESGRRVRVSKWAKRRAEVVAEPEEEGTK